MSPYRIARTAAREAWLRCQSSPLLSDQDRKDIEATIHDLETVLRVHQDAVSKARMEMVG